MKVNRHTLETCAHAEGIVVVVDVLRAFTTMAFAFDRGATEMYLVSGVEEAFELKARESDLVLVGEVNGYPIEGFDLPNSPSVIQGLDLTDRRLVLRTTAGTQGVTRSPPGSDLYVASLSVAAATARCVRSLEPETVSFVNTGVRPKGGGEEDAACSDYIESLVNRLPIDLSVIERRVTESKAALKFSDVGNSDFPADDLALALQIDRFSFAMRVFREENHLILRKAYG